MRFSLKSMPCPKCKKYVTVDALICPHCQTAFSPKQVAARKKEFWTGALGSVVLVLVILLFVSMCSDDQEEHPKPAGIAAPAATLTADQEKLMAELRQLWGWGGLCVDRMVDARRTFGETDKNPSALIDGYDRLKATIPTCEGVARDLAEYRFPAFGDPLDEQKSSDALSACRAVPKTSVAGIKKAVTYLDNGGGSVGEMSAVREGLEGALAEHRLCASALNDLAGSYGIPKSAGRFSF